VAAALNDSIILSAAAIKVVALIIILARIQARFAIFQFCSSSKLSSPLLSGPTRKRQNGGTFRGEKRVRIIRRTCGQKNSHHNRNVLVINAKNLSVCNDLRLRFSVSVFFFFFLLHIFCAHR